MYFIVFRSRQYVPIDQDCDHIVDPPGGLERVAQGAVEGLVPSNWTEAITTVRETANENQRRK
jgi:hypothetical protein